MTICVDEIIAKTGLDKTEAAQIAEQVQEEWERLSRIYDYDVLARQLDFHIKYTADHHQMQAIEAQQRTVQNIIHRNRMDTEIENLMAQGIKTPAEAVIAVLIGTHKGVKGGRVSVSTRRADLELRWIGKIVSEIQKFDESIFDLIKKDKAFLDDVVHEMFNVDGPVHATGNKHAQFLAKLLSEVSDSARYRLNTAGSNVRKLKGWVPQRHEVSKMMKVGKEEWKAKVLPLLDVERTFGKMKPEKYGEALDHVYETIIRGHDIDRAVSFEDVSLPGPANLADQLSKKHRTLHFQGSAEWLEYSEMFGSGNVVETVFAHLRETATQAASMEVMGTNPKGFMQRYMEHLDRRIWEDPNLTDEQKKKHSSKLPKDFNASNNAIQMAFNLVTGEADKPWKVSLAKFGSFARAWVSMSKLGMAALSSVTDLSTSAARIRFQGKGLFDGYAGMVGGLFEGKLSSEKKEIAYLLGIGFDGMLGDIHARFMAEDQVIGKLSKAQNLFFKMSGLTDWTERMRTTFAMMSSANMAQQTGKSFDQLDDFFKHSLEVHGIDANKWEAIRQIKKKAADGRDYIVPEAARELDSATVEKYIDAELKKYEVFLMDRLKNDPEGTKGKNFINAMAHRRDKLKAEAKRDIQDALQAYFIDETDYAVIRPDERTRMWQTAGLKPGTAWGEVVRFMMQFKSFPIAFTQRVMGTQFYGGRGGKMDKGGLAHVIASSTVLGFMAMTMKDVAKGREPRDPSKPATWMAAFMQGGGAGIYGDFLLGKYSRFGGGPLQTIEGPFLNTADDIAKIAVNALHGEVDGGEILYTAMNNTPFVNLWYTRIALDYSILYHLQEMASPGYLRRVERRMKKEYNQEHIIPPSTVIKRGGGYR